MKILAGIFFTFVILIVVAASRDTEKLPPEVTARVPAKFDLNAKKHRQAKRELQELVKACGPGIVEGAVGAKGRALDNRCSYQVRLDDLFFKNETEKTGLLEDSEWAYAPQTTFFESPPQDIPDNFDIRDLMKNGMPDLRTQKCGDCWAWATHHGLELARAVHDQKVFDHSIQTVLSCSRQGSCSGGYMSAVDFLRHGLPLESEFPYAASNKSCKFNSGQIETGWDAKVPNTPYVGSSLTFSRSLRTADGSFREGTKVKAMMDAIYQWKSPLVVTVSAYSVSGNGIVNSCSAINSGGNHMVTVVGWDTAEGKRIAHVWNSWGKGHGLNGVSRLQWECGNGRLNRGLGVAAKIVQYKPPCVAPNAEQIHLHEAVAGDPVKIGVEQAAGTKCSWLPTEGLTDASACVTYARPDISTEYHLTAKNDCGSSSSQTLVYLWGSTREQGGKKLVMTPFGQTEL